MGRFEQYGKGESHGIPYRCLTPKGLKNVLVAGRSISTDRSVQGSIRVMNVCICLGEAAGIAASMALNTGNVHSINTDKLRDSLKKHGAYLPLQMGFQRPNDECSLHRTPIKNLYVGGSSTYPGGCVIWGAGYLAANAVVEDLNGNKWWAEPETITKARKEGLL